VTNLNQSDPSLEYLYGVHPVSEALAADRRRFVEIWITLKHPDNKRSQLVESARKRGVPIRQVSAAKLRSQVGPVVHQGIAALVKPLPFVLLTNVLPQKSGDSAHGIWLLLDHITDPNNLGAIIRTALCAGVKAVIIPKDRSAPPSPAVSKASAGALEHMALCRVTNLAETIKKLKARGIWVAGLDADAKEPLFNHDLTGLIGLVIGGEEKGIRPRIKKQCDFLLSIPQVGAVSSLNASVAAAVVIFEALRQNQTRKRIENNLSP
jgi:23S rRNA (guanosine2251-2'-O)-methyltransferase